MQKRSLLQSEMPEGPLEVASQKELRAVARLTCRWRFSPLDAPALGSWLLEGKGDGDIESPIQIEPTPGLSWEGWARVHHFCLMSPRGVAGWGWGWCLGLKTET